MTAKNLKRPPSSAAMIWARAQFRPAFAQPDLAEALGISLRTIATYETKGAPAWMRFALAGLLFDYGRNDAAVKVLEREQEEMFSG